VLYTSNRPRITYGTGFAVAGVMNQIRSVLLVDDNAGLRSGLAGVLEDEGIRTHQAERGEEAIKLIHEVRFDLLVLDLNLPDMTGVRVYSTVKDHARTSCIFMTAEASEELIEQALRLDPLRLLRKPFEVKLFRELVRKAIAN
jgi:CheY-like chemotaxis protein